VRWRVLGEGGGQFHLEKPVSLRVRNFTNATMEKALDQAK